MFGFSVVVLMTVAVAAAEECANMKPVVNFDITKFAAGKWYVLGKFPNAGSKCGIDELYHDGKDLKIKAEFIFDGEKNFFNGSVIVADDVKETAELHITVTNQGQVTSSVMKVLDTDYNNYAVIQLCLESANRSGSRNIVMIFSRTQGLEGQAKVAVSEFLSTLKSAPGFATYKDLETSVLAVYQANGCQA